MLKFSHGNYTGDTVRRAGKIVGSLSRALDKAYSENVCEVESDDGYRRHYNYHDDIVKFLAMYQDDKLFTHIPGRCHKSFQNMQCDGIIKDPEKLKERLLKYSAKIHRARLAEL